MIRKGAAGIVLDIKMITFMMKTSPDFGHTGFYGAHIQIYKKTLIISCDTLILLLN